MSIKKLFPVVLLAILSILIYSCEKCEFTGISTSELPEGTEGVDYTVQIVLEHTCDPKMIYFSIVGGTLPAGLELSDDGLIDGTPVHEGEYTFTIRVEVCFSDDGSNYGDCYERTKGFYIKVNPAP